MHQPAGDYLGGLFHGASMTEAEYHALKLSIAQKRFIRRCYDTTVDNASLGTAAKKMAGLLARKGLVSLQPAGMRRIGAGHLQFQYQQWRLTDRGRQAWEHSVRQRRNKGGRPRHDTMPPKNLCSEA